MEMKNFEKNYKKQFLENNEPENRLDIIKQQLEFRDPVCLKKPKKSPKFKWIISGLSVALASVIIVILLFSFPNKITPVYTGMNVVDSSSVSVKHNSQQQTRDLDLNDIKIDYYAKKNDKLRVAIHLRNPEQYEILSFKINQRKYQSYEFKEGSNSEVIYIDLDCKDEAGIEEFFIDEMKYIDGDKIKDVKYEQNRSIYVALAYNTPEVTVSDENVGTTTYSFKFDLVDSDNLINEDNLYAKLYLEEKEIRELKVNKNNKFVEFKNIEMNKNYTVSLFTKSDLLDGNGLVELELHSKDFKTKSGLVKTNISTTRNSILGEFSSLDSTVNIIKSKLYLDNKLVSERNDNVVSFDNLYSNATYSLEVTYTYKLDNELCFDTLKFDDLNTKSYEKLTEKDINGIVLKFGNIISVDVDSIKGDFCQAKVDNIKLFADGKLLTESKDLSFEYIYDGPIKDFYIEILASYSLNEFNGKIYNITKTIKGGQL